MGPLLSTCVFNFSSKRQLILTIMTKSAGLRIALVVMVIATLLNFASWWLVPMKKKSRIKVKVMMELITSMMVQ